jgi:hypothetical protein
MAKWYSQVAEESSFKPVAGGYVFQAPHPWLFARSRTYLVNDAERTAIAACIRRRQKLMLVLLAVLFPVMFGLIALLMLVFHLPSPLVITLVSVLILVPLIGIPHLCLVRCLAPLLAGLPRTDQRITWREQFARSADAVPPTVLKVGLASAALMLLASVVGFADVVVEDGPLRRLVGPVSMLVLGALSGIYFVAMWRLKARQSRG